jgi:hypothetical protein
LIVRESFFEEDPSPVANRCVLPAYRHYAANVWLWTGIYDNFNDQAALSVIRRNSDDSIVYDDGIPVRDARIEPITSEVWFCRDFQTIYDVAVRRMSFASLGSYQQYFDLPTPEVIEDIELAKKILVTHRAGRIAGGYSQEELKIIGTSMDLASFRTTLTTVRSVPGTILGSAGGGSRPTVVITGTVTMSGESELTATYFTAYQYLVSALGASTDGHSAVTNETDTSTADLLIAAVADSNASGGSLVTDNYGNTWNRMPPNLVVNLDGSLDQIQLWFSKPTAVGPHHTATATEAIPSSSSFPSIVMAAFRTSHLTAPFDTETGAYSNNPVDTTLSPGLITPAEDGELVVTALATDTDVSGTIAIDEGFSIIQIVPKSATAFGLALAYLIQDAAAAVDPTWDSGLGSGPGMSASIVALRKAV